MSVYSFFSFFSFRLSLMLSWGFFRCSLLPLSFFPLSPMAVAPFLVSGSHWIAIQPVSAAGYNLFRLQFSAAALALEVAGLRLIR